MARSKRRSATRQLVSPDREQAVAQVCHALLARIPARPARRTLAFPSSCVGRYGLGACSTRAMDACFIRPGDAARVVGTGRVCEGHLPSLATPPFGQRPADCAGDRTPSRPGARRRPATGQARSAAARGVLRERVRGLRVGCLQRPDAGLAGRDEPVAAGAPGRGRRSDLKRGVGMRWTHGRRLPRAIRHQRLASDGPGAAARLSGLVRKAPGCAIGGDAPCAQGNAACDRGPEPCAQSFLPCGRGSGALRARLGGLRPGPTSLARKALCVAAGALQPCPQGLFACAQASES
jgi:hypothetical protein